MTNQVGEEHHSAVEQRHDHQFTPGKVFLQLLRQLPDSPGNLFFGDKNAFEV